MSLFRILLLLCISVSYAVAQSPTPLEARQNDRINRLERKVADVEIQTKKALTEAAGTGGLVFLCAAFCALWAQNTGRSAWLWFFLGLFFNFLSLVVLLIKNSNDLTMRRLRDL